MNIEDVIEFIQTASSADKARIRKALETKVQRKLNFQTLRRNVMEQIDAPFEHQNEFFREVRGRILNDFQGTCSLVGVTEEDTISQASKKIMSYLTQEVKAAEESFRKQNKSSIGVRYNPETGRNETFYQ